MEYSTWQHFPEYSAEHTDWRNTPGYSPISPSSDYDDRSPPIVYETTSPLPFKRKQARSAKRIAYKNPIEIDRKQCNSDRLKGILAKWLLSDSMKFRRALQIELAHNFDTYLIVCTQQSIQFSTTMPSFCVQSNQHLTCYAFTL
ncbi:hypothetical protein Tcan_10550 [Toxocara canis]|uniref:Ground-like domain-containing protein n=1 Tax=Toxocara canis TaxID=6265 RepID=A0A0B2V4L8_TOXCA|nr:hypothetical protein Tcan_10550 [Toxocara canis]